MTTTVHINRRLDHLLKQLDDIRALIIALQNGVANAGDLFPDLPEPDQRRRTGYRMVRGTHATSYVKDPQGTDPLPAAYGTIPERKP